MRPFRGEVLSLHRLGRFFISLEAPHFYKGKDRPLLNVDKAGFVQLISYKRKNNI